MSGSPLAGRSELPAAGGAIHLVGIAGAGMRGLAVLLHHAGYAVSGCDQSGPEGLDDLTARGVRVDGDHDPSHVAAADLVIRSSAVPPDSPEIAAAAAAGVPILRRARALGAVLNGAPLVGIAGTHGKTTITAMAGYACEAAALDPTVLVGGHVNAWDGFARIGAGPAVVEADEYDRSFLELDPTVALVSSLEAEHLDTYGDFDSLRAAFREFAARASARSGVLYCADDAGARELGGSVSHAHGYGFADDAEYRLAPQAPHGRWRLIWSEGDVDLRLRVPGRHNAQNAAGAFAAAVTLGGDPDAVAAGLAAFPGVDRRLEVLGTWGAATIVDDYAHHPTEVAASIEALHAAYPDAIVQVIFQPHLFTRTRDFAAAFAGALEEADAAHVLPIYPAREAPIDGVTARLITDAGSATPICAADVLDLVRDALAGAERSVIAFMGAGSVTELAHRAVGAAEGMAGRTSNGAVGA